MTLKEPRVTQNITQLLPAFAPLMRAIEATDYRWSRLQECLGVSSNLATLHLGCDAYEDANAQLQAQLKELGLKTFQLYKLGAFEQLRLQRQDIELNQINAEPEPEPPREVQPGLVIEPEPSHEAQPEFTLEPEPEPEPESAPEEQTPAPIPITARDLTNLNLTLQGYEPPTDEPEAQAPPPPVTLRAHEAWQLCRELPEKVRTTTTFSREYAALQSLISVDYFNESWLEVDVEILDKLYRFFNAKIRYLSTLPHKRRPPQAKGNGAFESLLNHLRQRGNDTAHEALNQKGPSTSSWWTDIQALQFELDEHFSSANRAQKKVKAEFNPERALDELRELVQGDQGDERSIRDKALDMLKRGVSPMDPRMLSILRDQVQILTGSELKSLRSKIRKHLRAEEQRALLDQQDPTQIKDAARLDGKRIALIGGDSRVALTDWLQEQLPNAKVDWIATSKRTGTRQAQSLVDRINYGNVDYTLIIQDFVSHGISKPIMEAAKQSPHGVRAEYVFNGYGQAQISSALERCLSA